jgi:hypothetical protein
MRVLRLLRPARSTASALQASGPREAAGLDAFATEAPGPQLPAQAAGVEKLEFAVIVLGALVVLEAVPAVLWLGSQFGPAEPATTIAAAPIAPAPIPPEAVSAATPCAPTNGQQGAVAAAATSGTGAELARTPARAAAPGLVAGLVAIEAPVPMHVYTDGKLVGTTEAESIMLPVGQHDLDMVSESVGFRARRTVTIQAGRTASVQIEAPRVPVHINAMPWAEVWVDNQRVGETPLGNLQQTIGSHEVVFRHPELGERRMVVNVTMKEPARISMDLRKK